MTTRRAADSETAPATGLKKRSNKALDGFIAAKVNITTILEHLKAISKAHFETPQRDRLGECLAC